MAYTRADNPADRKLGEPSAIWKMGAIALLLTALLLLSSGCADQVGAPETTGATSPAETDSVETEGEPSEASDPMQGGDSQELPAEVRSQVLAIASQDLEASADALQVAEASRQTWPDGCLGLPREGELCTMALIEGWRIEVIHDGETTTYRTDLTGGVIRRVSSNEP